MRASLTGMVLLTGTTAWAVDFHVAPGGRDAGTGAADAPFATLVRARDAVRALKKSCTLKGPVRISYTAGSMP